MKPFSLACALAIAVLAARGPLAQDYKSILPAGHPAIRYGRAPADDPVSRLSAQIERGSVALAARPGPAGLLAALLDHLRINIDSQMLVFSKTSFQAARIGPGRPRAIYFNDEASVGYVPGAPTLEIIAIDPVQGPLFYTMTSSGTPEIRRAGTCLRCHQGPNTAGVPGLYVGSVIPGPTGAPLGGDTAIVTDHRSPFRDRWGGWYVTARQGEQPDRANAVASNPADPATLVREARQNVPTLAGLFDDTPYLAPSSDIVALMTFEHQTQMTNLITRVGWDARIAASGDDNAGATLDADLEELVAYMLFAGEAPLRAPIAGTSSFARTFPLGGPRDRRGRSLRDFDLRTRLFRYPLSYMIYSAGFGALPEAVRRRIYRRLYDTLTAAGHPRSDERPALESRRAILEILRETKPDLPAYWRPGS